MTKDEALHLALENINKAHAKVAALCEGSERWTMNVPPRPDYDHDIVITNALLAAETVINEALAQPKQEQGEPVAWFDSADNVFYTKEDAHKTGFAPIRALYTTPPQRPWVGLTDEDKLKELNT